jgi:putative resolvase
VKALEAYCQQNAIKVDEWMFDIGSGLNYKHKQYRLVRFGYDYFEAFCERHHTEIVVMGGEAMSPEQELVRDLIAIVSVFSASLHGLRSYRKAIKDAALRKE